MSISSVNCTPIKPNVSFGGKEREKHEKICEATDKFNDQYVKSSDIKKPLAVGASVALAAIASYATGRGVTNLATSKFAPNAGEVVEKHLKSAANTVKTKAEELINTPQDKTLSTVRQLAGKAVSKAEEGARTVYKKVAYLGLPKEVQNPERARKALGNVVGAGTAVAATTDICTVDSNKDGVADIFQKSQNAYTGAKTNFQNAFEAINAVSEIAQVIA